MSMRQRSKNFLALTFIALVSAASAEASASRTFVATTGSDANTATNCGATTPCRTFGSALSVTNPGGELVVINSGGYGPATISESVAITAIGIDASISVTTSGGTGLAIATSGDVTIVGLNLHGEAAGANGIKVTEVNYLRVYNVTIENFTNDGIEFNADGKIALYNSTIDLNTQNGFQLQSGLAYVSNTDFDDNGHGVEVDGASVAEIVDSTANLNFGGFFANFGGTINLFNDRVTFNNVGLVTGGTGAAALNFAYCFIASNATAYSIGSGTTIAGSNPGTSVIASGQTRTGTLSTGQVLE